MHQCHPLGGAGTPGSWIPQAIPANEMFFLPGLTNKLLLIFIVIIFMLICEFGRGLLYRRLAEGWQGAPCLWVSRPWRWAGTLGRGRSSADEEKSLNPFSKVVCWSVWLQEAGVLPRTEIKGGFQAGERTPAFSRCRICIWRRTAKRPDWWRMLCGASSLWKTQYLESQSLFDY